MRETAVECVPALYQHKLRGERSIVVMRTPNGSHRRHATGVVCGRPWKRHLVNSQQLHRVRESRFYEVVLHPLLVPFPKQ